MADEPSPAGEGNRVATASGMLMPFVPGAATAVEAVGAGTAAAVAGAWFSTVAACCNVVAGDAEARGWRVNDTDLTGPAETL